VTVNQGGKVYAQDATIGSSGSNNTVLVTDAGTQWRTTASLTLGSQANSTGNQLVISNGAVAQGVASTIGGGSNANNNTVLVTGTGSVWSNTGLLVIGYTNAYNNSVTVNNGAKLTALGLTIGSGINASNNSLSVANGTLTSGLLTVGLLGGNNSLSLGNVTASGSGAVVGSGSSNNTVTVWNTAWNLGSPGLTVGSGAAANNAVTIYNSTVSNAAVVVVGSGKNGALVTTNAVGNQLVISNSTVLASSLRAGTATGDVNNAILITGGSLVEANQLLIGSGGSGNTISNVGGIFQFTTPGVTVSPNGTGNIVLQDGTISYRVTAVADISNNLAGALSGITFAGQNTFRLLGTSNTVAGQTYTFQVVAGMPSNYVNLALVNGNTAYRGGNLTIGATGSLLASNTSATITGLFTNNGLTRVVNATAAFSNGIVNAGVLALQTGIVSGNVTNLSLGLIQGNGTVRGSVTNFGTISPGFSVGSLTITGNLSLAGSSVVVLELSGYGAGVGTNDTIAVGQRFTYGGTLVVSNLTGFAYAAGQSFQLFSFGSQGGDFSASVLPDLSGAGLMWDTGTLDSAGVLSIVIIPEPSVLVLLAGALAGLFVFRRRRNFRNPRAESVP